MQPNRDPSGEVVIEEKRHDVDDVYVTRMPNEEPPTATSFDEITSSVKEVAQKTGQAINRATESIGKAIESALSARDHVVMVRVNDESLRSLDSLVQSGIFKSRSESAAFLIGEGIKAQKALFARIADRISEIERLRNELKNIVNSDQSSEE